jgi:hypothetical protein
VSLNRDDQPFSADDKVIEVPWRTVPVSEPLLPGEASAAVREREGWTIFMPALVSVIANVTTSAARQLLEQGLVTMDGLKADPAFGKVKPGMLVTVREKKYRIGEPETQPRWR